MSAALPSGFEPILEQAEPRVRAIGSTDDSSPDDEKRELRGRGYAWGGLLRGLYQTGTRSPEGKWRLDVTELEKSLKGFNRGVSLEDASAPAADRAEYLASVITAALDMNGSEQPRSAEILRRYYQSDGDRRGVDEHEQRTERTQLSQEARDELLSLFTPEARIWFQEIFSAPDFLFRSMSIAADEITMEKSGNVLVAGHGALLSIESNGTVRVESGTSKVTIVSPPEGSALPPTLRE